MSTAICPGSFDPVTLGHLDIIERANRIFDKVIVAILDNPSKSYMFDLEERIEMLRESCSYMNGVEIDHFNGLLVDYMKNRDTKVVVRGLRAVSDFEYEFTMALMNKKLYKDMEMFYMMSANEYEFVSSSIIKEVANLGGDVDSMVPSIVAKKLKEKCNL